MWKTRDRKAQTVKELRDSMLTKFKKKYIGNWEFYRRYLLLAIPMILQNAITNLVSFLDNIMVGQLGTEQMSGVAIVIIPVLGSGIAVKSRTKLPQSRRDPLITNALPESVPLDATSPSTAKSPRYA